MIQENGNGCHIQIRKFRIKCTRTDTGYREGYIWGIHGNGKSGHNVAMLLRLFIHALHFRIMQFFLLNFSLSNCKTADLAKDL